MGDREARDLARRAIDLADRQGGAHSMSSRAYWLRALLADREGTAVAELEPAVVDMERRVAEQGWRSYRPLVHLGRAELARRRGDDPGREQHLREAHRLYTEMGATGHAGRVAKELSARR